MPAFINKLIRLQKRYFNKSKRPYEKCLNNSGSNEYSCCRNIGSVIASHNRRVIQPSSNSHGCNCRKRADCPLHNKCLTTNIVYKVAVSAPSNPRKKYDGIAETTFKVRFRNHTRDFHHKKYVNSTELTRYKWILKNENLTPNIKWNI